MNDAVLKSHTATHQRHYALPDPAVFILPVTGAEVRLGSVSVFWTRSLPDGDWTPSVAAGIGTWPYTGSVLSSNTVPQLLDFFDDLVEESHPMALALAGRFDEQPANYLVKSDGSRVSLGY